MRITCIAPHADLSGGIRVIASIASGLQKHGHKVRVISQPPAVPSLRERMSNALRGRHSSANAQGDSHFDGCDFEHTILPARRPIADTDVADGDIVIATWWETANWVAALSPAKGTKAYFVQLDERAIIPGNADWAKRVAATWRLPLFKIATSRCVQRMLLAESDQVDIPVVVNGVDPSRFFAPARAKQAVPTVGFLYGSSHRKGFDVIRRVLARVRGEVSKVRSVAITAETRIPPEASEFGEVHRRPSQDHLQKIYASCDVWLCASRAEGFHLPPMEAMACRCPVVSTRVGGPEDMVEEGVSGYLADVDDVEKLAEGLVRVLNAPEQQWRRMSQAAAETARRYTWEEAAAQFEASLRRVAGKSESSQSVPLAGSIL